jgi:hypothetical protein
MQRSTQHPTYLPQPHSLSAHILLLVVVRASSLSHARAFSLLQVHASKGKKGGGTAEGSSGDDAEGEPLEKKQKPVDASKAAEKRRAEKKKSLKRL